MKRRSIFAAVSALSLITTVSLLIAGPLAPPVGPVAPTYKTLTEVEPRIAINATNTPGDADSTYRITAPGSYYLTGNIQVGTAGKSGIEIVTGNVSIDLNGFSVIGSAGTLSGIVLSGSNRPDVSIRNGSVRGWGANGIDLGGAVGARLHHLNASANGTHGFISGSTANASHCTALGNASGGFLFSSGATIDSCTASSNSGIGFRSFDGCTFSRCTASGNGGSGFHTDYSNSLSACSAIENGDSGFSLSLNCVIVDSAASSNTDSGIAAGDGCLIRGNTCMFNGAGHGAGIDAIGVVRCRIEGNTCTENVIGIWVTGTNNFVSRNTCAANTSNNWMVAAGNKCLVVNGVNCGAINGNSGGVSPGSTDPNANFTY